MKQKKCQSDIKVKVTAEFGWPILSDFQRYTALIFSNKEYLRFYFNEVVSVSTAN